MPNDCNLSTLSNDIDTKIHKFSSINQILNIFGYYKISQLKVGGHCGSCGKAMSNTIFVDDGWNWELCKECLNK